MLARVRSGGLRGIDALVVDVEVDVSSGLPHTTTVGLPDGAVREGTERIRAALRNCGFKHAERRVTVNLGPAGVRKEGAAFDLPIALGLLAAFGDFGLPDLSRWCVLGELGLDGRVHGARGALPIAAAASRAALGALMVPAVNAPSSLAAKISVARATCIRPRGSDVALSTMENPRTSRELGRDDTRLHRRPSTSADRLGDGVESGLGALADKTKQGERLMQSRPSVVSTCARRLRLTIAGLAAVGVLLAGPAARAAFLPLPANGSQVNNDVANAIDPNQDAGVSDVAGGTVKAGNVQVPWATFEQKSRDGQQIFVRAFKNGAWVTQGFPASLNIDPTAEAEAPSIDFAGAGRTVPWVAWYEPNAAFGPPTNIFASRFNAGANLWLPSGQDRSGGSHLPSLNIHTDRTAENPSVAGGAAVAGADPVPWVVWEENDGVASDTTLRQIFVVKGLKQATAGAACPVGTLPAGENNENGFCWQQVGLERLDPTSPTPLDKGDPTLNIDPTRSGVEPDIAFTGKDDTVAWVVWYEEDPTGISGLRNNDMVFASKIVAEGAADGGFHWLAVGNGTAGQTT